MPTEATISYGTSLNESPRYILYPSESTDNSWNDFAWEWKQLTNTDYVTVDHYETAEQLLRSYFITPYSQFSGSFTFTTDDNGKVVDEEEVMEPPTELLLYLTEQAKETEELHED